MPDTLWAALIGAAAAVVIQTATQLSLWLRDKSERDHSTRRARADRLRALYADVIEAAIACTPPSLGYRFGPDFDGRSPGLDAIAVDAMRARLEVEAADDGQDVLKAFIGVANGSRLAAINASNKAHSNESVPQAEIRKDEKMVRDAMDALQDACRRRLKVLAS